MHRMLVLLIVLGLLLPAAGSAGTTVVAAGNPFTSPSLRNDASGTVSTLPVQEDSVTVFLRPESRHPLLRFPPSRADLPTPCDTHGAARITTAPSVFPSPVSYGLPPECGLTVVRLARADH